MAMQARFDAPAKPTTPTWRAQGLVSFAIAAGPNHRVKRHQHIEHELIVPVAGRYHCLLNQQPVNIEAGTALLVLPGDWHEDLPSGSQLDYHAVTFDLSDSHGHVLGFFDRHHQLRDQLIPVDTARIVAHIEHLQAAAEQPGNLASQIFSNCLSAVVCDLILACQQRPLAAALRESQASSDNHNHTQAQLTRLFIAHENTTLSVAAMATALGVSERGLRQRCQNHLGCSPAQAFSRHKVIRAQALLSKTDMSVGEVADYLGFSDQYHFSKVFKRHTGVAPSQHRLHTKGKVPE